MFIAYSFRVNFENRGSHNLNFLIHTEIILSSHKCSQLLSTHLRILTHDFGSPGVNNKLTDLHWFASQFWPITLAIKMKIKREFCFKSCIFVAAVIISALSQKCYWSHHRRELSLCTARGSSLWTRSRPPVLIMSKLEQITLAAWFCNLWIWLILILLQPQTLHA